MALRDVVVGHSGAVQGLGSSPPRNPPHNRSHPAQRRAAVASRQCACAVGAPTPKMAARPPCCPAPFSGPGSVGRRLVRGRSLPFQCRHGSTGFLSLAQPQVPVHHRQLRGGEGEGGGLEEGEWGRQRGARAVPGPTRACAPGAGAGSSAGLLGTIPPP